jgi:hypothetical protein
VLASILSIRWHGESMLDLCHSHSVGGRPFIGRHCGSRDRSFVDWQSCDQRHLGTLLVE